ncbi:hypothetical protein EV715DRAFT_212591, partial [Schizophyllum commune]
PTLRARLTAFGDALLAASPPIAGLDRSIVIDPRRVHLTLGVMRLEKEDAAATACGKDDNADPPKKIPSTALALLRSLAPQLAALGPARVDLERLGVLKTQKGGREANVLWSASGGTEKSSLYAIADLVHQTFRREGYITETRPLKLHVTLLNTTHRKKPRRRLAFSYTDVLQSEAVKLLGAVLPGPAKAGDAEVSSVFVPAMHAVHLCEMGSHGPDNEYVSVGCVEF